MLLDIKNGQTSVVLRVKLLNSSVTTGAGLTGLTSASSGLIISTIADNEQTAIAYTVAASNVETITTLGTYAAPTASKCRFKEVDATNHPGVYEIHIADARFAVASAKSLLISVSGATNLVQADILIPLRSVDPYDSVRFGLTAIPNAAANTTGGIIVKGSNAVDSLAAGAITAAAIADGAIDAATFAAGAITATVIADGAIDAATFAANALDGVWSVSARTITGGTIGTYTGNTPQTGDSYARLGAPAGASIAADVALGLTYIDTEVAAIKAKTDLIPASPAAVGSAMGLASTAFDNIVIEAGINARQALSPILAAAAGKLSGAGTGTIDIKGADNSTTRISATTDSSGNRSAVTLTLPA